MQSKFLLSVVLVFLIADLVGCGRHGTAAAPADGQAFNAVQYCQDFTSASPELRTLANRAWTSIQAGAFPKAQKELNQLAANPALNEAQKKSVADLTAQLKKQIELRAGQ